MVLLSFLCLSVLAEALLTTPPDVSLSTIPVAYYGANWNRSQHNIDVLARMQMVVLLQEEGHCFATCCPRRFDGPRQCGWRPSDPAATTIEGCDSSCDQHSVQEDSFKRIKASAGRQGLRSPHAILYMNAVYLWPFDKAAKLGTLASVTDENGKPHEESCDPGIFPSYFFDFGKPLGAKAWLDIIQTHVVDGAADGVYVDNDQQIPFKCKDGADFCTARRNGHLKSINERVTKASVEAYRAGHNKTLIEGFQLVTGVGGTFYNKGAPSNRTFAECVNYDPATGTGRMEGACSGNLIWSGPNILPPPHLSAYVRSNMKAGKPYVIIAGSNRLSNPQLESLPEGQNLDDGRSFHICSDDFVAQFLLAVEPGAYLLCNSWDERFERPLGLPLGLAVLNGTVWERKFQSGVVATWDTNSKIGKVMWPSVTKEIMVI